MEYGVINEIGDLGYGFNVLNEEDQQKLKEQDKQQDKED